MVFPTARAGLTVGDPAVVKVRAASDMPLFLYFTHSRVAYAAGPSPTTGNYHVSSAIPEANAHLPRAVCLWAQHRLLRVRGTQEVPQSCGTQLQRGTVLVAVYAAAVRLSCLHPQRNNRLVWDETVRLPPCVPEAPSTDAQMSPQVKIVLGLFETPDWKGKSAVHIDHCIDITLPVSCFPRPVALRLVI